MHSSFLTTLVHIKGAALFFVVIFQLTGCAGWQASPGEQALEDEDYASAVVALQKEEITRPQDARIKRNLGIAMLETGDASGALAKLQKANELKPGDKTTLYHLGRAAEEAGDTELAIESYAEYLSLNRSPPPEVEARIETLTAQKITAEVRLAIAGEEQLATATTPQNTVAVPDFINLVDNPELDPLSRGLAIMLVTDLSKVEELRVLERQRVHVLLDELEMASPPDTPPSERASVDDIPSAKRALGTLLRPGTDEPYFQGPTTDDVEDPAFTDALREFQAAHGLDVDGLIGPKTFRIMETALADQQAPTTERGVGIDPATAPRLGALIGARQFVLGGFASFGDAEIRLDASMIDVPTGTLEKAGTEVSGPLERLLFLEKELVYNILDAMGIEPTPEEREFIDQMPTQNFEAFLAFSRGVRFVEIGRPVEARAAFSEAVSRDPGFQMAKNREAISRVTPERQTALNRAELSVTLGLEVNLESQLAGIGTWIGIGPGPLENRFGGTDPSTTPYQKVPVGTIVVQGDLP